MMAALSSGWTETFQPSLLVGRWKWRRSEMGFWRTRIFIQEICQHTHRSLFLAKGRQSNVDSAQDPRVVACECGLSANRLVMSTLLITFQQGLSTHVSSHETFIWISCTASFSNCLQDRLQGSQVHLRRLQLFPPPSFNLSTIRLHDHTMANVVCWCFGHSFLLTFLHTVCYAWNLFPSKLSTLPTLTQLSSVSLVFCLFVFKDVII